MFNDNDDGEVRWIPNRARKIEREHAMKINLTQQNVENLNRYLSTGKNLQTRPKNV